MSNLMELRLEVVMQKSVGHFKGIFFFCLILKPACFACKAVAAAGGWRWHHVQHCYSWVTVLMKVLGVKINVCLFPQCELVVWRLMLKNFNKASERKKAWVVQKKILTAWMSTPPLRSVLIFFARWPNLRIMPSVSLTAFFNPLCKVINMCCLVSNYLSAFFTLLMHLFLCDFDTDDFDLKNC